MKACHSVWLLVFGAACSSAPPDPAPAGPVPKDESGRPAPVATAARGPDQAPAPTRLANGVTIAVLPPTTTGQAELQLSLPGGTDCGAPGIAELAATTLVENGDASQGRASLQQTIARLGGTVDLEVSALSTWLTLRVPQSRWPEAHRALAAALAAPALSRNQLERIRDEFVQRRVAAITNDQVREAARAFLLGETSTAAHVTALLDRDPSEITLFLARLYRPEAATLSLRVAGEPAKIVEALAAGIGTWPATATAQPQLPVQTRRLQPGIHWAPGEPATFCRVCLILPLPEITREDAADLFVLHACLTLDGTGGRLEQLQREQGLAQWRWQSQLLSFADVAALVLSVDTTPAAAVELWRTVVAARASLRDVPPTGSELALALRRGALTARLGESGAAQRLRNQTLLAMKNLPPDALARRFAALGKAGTFDAVRTADAYLKLPAAMLVFGGKVPDGLSDVVTFTALPVGAEARMTAADVAAQTVAAAPWLDEAMEAVGGAPLLRRFDGFATAAQLQTDHSPGATEQLQWRRSGVLQRTRRVLGADIVTVLDGTSWTEQAGEVKVILSGREAARLRAEQARHPLAVLAACARGELKFRPVAQRSVGDRDLMILESVGETFDRLRIHIDTTSHLIRVVETWETSADSSSGGTIVHLQEAWSDYRTSLGLRVPFRRIVEQDDGQNRVETVYSKWLPVLLAP